MPEYSVMDSERDQTVFSVRKEYASHKELV